MLTSRRSYYEMPKIKRPKFQKAEISKGQNFKIPDLKGRNFKRPKTCKHENSLYGRKMVASGPSLAALAKVHLHQFFGLIFSFRY